MHGAIETEYGGCKFRSRLEARWAVFFDKLGIQWKYETQGFEADGHRYLPDFYLPESNDWIEVKGDPQGMDERRMRAVLSEQSPLPGFAAGDSSLLVLGDIPRADEGTVLHQVLTRQGLSCRAGDLTSMWCFFAPAKGKWAPVLVQPSIALTLFGAEFGPGVGTLEHDGGWVVRHEVLPTKVRFTPVFDAYRAARHARFEHGANGA